MSDNALIASDNAWIVSDNALSDVRLCITHDPKYGIINVYGKAMR